LEVSGAVNSVPSQDFTWRLATMRFLQPHQEHRAQPIEEWFRASNSLEFLSGIAPITSS
jgi:hypothetical protein